MWGPETRLDNCRNLALHATCDVYDRNSVASPSVPKGSTISILSFYASWVAPNILWVLDDPAEQIEVARTDAFGDLVHEHRKYLQGLVEQESISSSLAAEAMTIWWRLSDAVEGDLAMPDAAPGGDGELLYIWKRGDHYLSLEMTEEGAEFFYRDRGTGGIWAPLTTRRRLCSLRSLPG